MSKKVLILSSSPRVGSNSEALAEAFGRGAAEAGNQVEMVRLRELRYGFCLGCMACQETHTCVLGDDMASVAEKAREADVLVFATPIYYYSVSGQLKTALDRLNPLYGTDYAFQDVYLLTAAADDENTAPRGAVKAVQGWVDCFERCSLSGVVFAGGVNDPGDAASHPALQEAFDMGKSV